MDVLRFFASRALVLYALSGQLGCGSTTAVTPQPPSDPVVFFAHAPLSVELADGSKHDVVDRRVDDAQVIRADRGDALIVLGDGQLRVWLRMGTEIAVARSAGAPVLTLLKGEIRASDRDGTSTAFLMSADASAAPTSLTGRDVLASLSRSTMSVVDTLGALESADWTLEAGTNDLDASFGSLASGAGEAIELRRVAIRAAHRDDMVAMEVEHVFHNAADETVEGTFRFPLPAGAILTGLAMTIDGVLMEGEIVEREKAREIYERIVDEMRDPALLEWEQGRQLKLRVFPIEGKADKHVVVRYLMPLARTLEGPAVALDLVAPALQSGPLAVTVDFDGKPVLNDPNFVTGRRLSISVPEAALERESVLRQPVGDAVFTRLHVAPDLGAARPSMQTVRRLLVVVDTSRSSLEARALARQTLAAALGELRDRDQFAVLASDVVVSPLTVGYVSATVASVETVLSAFDAIEPDGASDLGAAFEAAGRALDANLAGQQVLYIGDGTPTWGETKADALLELAQRQLGPVALHAAVLGRAADAGLLVNIAGATGGKVVEPTTSLDAKRFGLFLRQALGAPRLRNARVQVEGGDVYPKKVRTFFPGDSLDVLIRQDATAPLYARLIGTMDGREFSQPLGLNAPLRASTTAARRFATAEIAALTRLDGPGNKDRIIKLSKDFGVMSKYTALLVLENEEAYKRHKIVRRRGPKSDPTVSGGDLESLSADEARLSPDHIQPGDPEIRVPAPEDARSVVMVFPFGETKIARFEARLKAWTVRFLIPKSTPDGLYTVVVRITHSDGRVETLELDYVVDTQAPQIAVKINRTGRTWQLDARPIVRQLPTRRRSDLIVAGGDDVPQARIVGDTIRVEARLPNGRVIRLKPNGAGGFSGTWRQRLALPENPQIRLVAIDRARNRSVETYPLTVRGFDDPTPGFDSEVE
ncbi:MAG: hypothetical protein ACI9OJ_000451 [Myxococcota bacterium]|jgi:hypothetical protein